MSYASDLINAFEAGKAGKEERRKRDQMKQFGEYAGQLYGAEDRAPILKNMAMINPGATMEYDQYLRNQDELSGKKQKEQAIKDARRRLYGVNAVVSSQSPSKTLATMFPQELETLRSQGIEPDDNMIREWAQNELPNLYADAGMEMPMQGKPKPDVRVVGNSLVSVGADGKPSVLYSDSREATQRPGSKFSQLSKEEAAALGLPPGTVAQRDVNTGKIDIVVNPQRATSLRQVPSAIAQGFASNRNEISKLEKAIEAVTKNPKAFGVKNYAPDAVVQRMDKKGVDPRAKVADIGSMIVHDRSGAAVTASEYPRLRPFIPQATDDPDVVITKLKNLKATLESMQEENASLFTEESGYKPLVPASSVQPASTGWGKAEVVR